MSDNIFIQNKVKELLHQLKETPKSQHFAIMFNGLADSYNKGKIVGHNGCAEIAQNAIKHLQAKNHKPINKMELPK